MKPNVELPTVITVLAIILAPLFTLYISKYLEEKRQKYFNKYNILQTLMANRHDPIHIDNIRALNMIDLVFRDSPRVRKLWREYFEMLNNEGLNNQNGWKLRNDKRNELIVEIASSIGLSKKITSLDIERTYIPEGIVDNMTKSKELLEELLRVLKSTNQLLIKPK